VISGIAGYLANAPRIVIPSGQGALGPALVTVGQAYEDYRSHSAVHASHGDVLAALFGHRVEFTFPQIWGTKGETLNEYVEASRDQAWSSTRSCWRRTGRSASTAKRGSVEFVLRAAATDERPRCRSCGTSGAVRVARLSVARFEDGAAVVLTRKDHDSMREYAIAGVLHMDHGRAARIKANVPALNASFQLGVALGIPARTRSKTRASPARYRDSGTPSFGRSKALVRPRWAGSVEQ
jgi:hypothetical protein